VPCRPTYGVARLCRVLAVKRRQGYYECPHQTDVETEHRICESVFEKCQALMSLRVQARRPVNEPGPSKTARPPVAVPSASS
jgi:hypothetical protein